MMRDERWEMAAVIAYEVKSLGNSGHRYNVITHPTPTWPPICVICTLLTVTSLRGLTKHLKQDQSPIPFKIFVHPHAVVFTVYTRYQCRNNDRLNLQALLNIHPRPLPRRPLLPLLAHRRQLRLLPPASP